MKVLLITPYIPYPLNEGGKVSQFAIINHIRKKVTVTLAFAIYENGQYESYVTLKNLLPDIRIEYLDLRNKKSHLNLVAKITDKGVRLLNRINNMLGHEATNRVNKNIIDDSQLSSPVPEILASFFENLVKKQVFDLIQVDHLQYISLGILLSQYAPSVFMHHEIRYARILSDINKNESSGSSYEKYLSKLTLAQEKALLSHYTGVMVFSEVDKMKLTDILSEELQVFVSQFPVLEEGITHFSEEDCSIKKLVFVGGDLHYPNKDAAEWYIEEMAESVYGKTGLQLHIIGSWGDEFKIKYKGRREVVFTGYVDNVIEYCRNSIMVVPIRIGSGIRTKILYAMAQGVPVVSTAIGAEGIIAQPGEDYLLADTTDKFVQQIEVLQNDSKLAYELATNAQSCIMKNYTEDVAGEKRIKVYEALLEKEACNF